MDLFNLKSLVLLLLAVGCCLGQDALPPGPIDGVSGKNVTFKTIVGPGEKFLTITWTFHGTPVITSSPGGATIGTGYEGRVKVNPTTGEMELRSLTPEDSGTYSVSMVPDPGEAKIGETMLRVLEPVSNLVIKSDMAEAIEFNSTVKLNCSANGSFLKFTWTNGTVPVVIDGNHITVIKGDDFTSPWSQLTVAGVLRSDLVGPIYCTASNALEVEKSAPFNLSVSYGPENMVMVVAPASEIHKKGSNITLTCSAQSSPAAVLQWIHNGKPLTETSSKLVLAKAAEAQGGNYSCTAFNAKTKRTISSIMAKITVIEAISGTNITGPTTTLVAGNSTASFSCKAGAGTGKAVWLKGGAPLLPSNRVNISADMSSVVIKPVQKEDSGEYHCKLTNAVSADSASYKILVNYGPETGLVEGEAAVEVKDPVMLKCSVVSVPPATYTWKFNGTLTIVKTADYAIPSAVYKNSGTYTCMAHNAITGLSMSVDHKLSVKEEGALDEGLSGGAIAGIVIGVLVALVAIIAIVIYMRKKGPVESPY